MQRLDPRIFFSSLLNFIEFHRKNTGAGKGVSSGNAPADSLPAAKTDGYNTVMPWQMYAGMTEQDIKAIYAYLVSLEPNEHRVIKFTPKSELALEK